VALPRSRGDQHDTLTESERGLDRVGQARRIWVRHRKPGLGVDRAATRGELGALGRLRVADDVAVDDDLDAVALVLVEGRRLGEVVHLPVAADADEALSPGAVRDQIP